METRFSGVPRAGSHCTASLSPSSLQTPKNPSPVCVSKRQEPSPWEHVHRDFTKAGDKRVKENTLLFASLQEPFLTSYQRHEVTQGWVAS